MDFLVPQEEPSFLGQPLDDEFVFIALPDTVMARGKDPTSISRPPEDREFQR